MPAVSEPPLPGGSTSIRTIFIIPPLQLWNWNQHLLVKFLLFTPDPPSCQYRPPLPNSRSTKTKHGLYRLMISWSILISGGLLMAQRLSLALLLYRQYQYQLLLLLLQILSIFDRIFNPNHRILCIWHVLITFSTTEEHTTIIITWRMAQFVRSWSRPYQVDIEMIRLTIQRCCEKPLSPISIASSSMMVDIDAKAYRLQTRTIAIHLWMDHNAGEN